MDVCVSLGEESIIRTTNGLASQLKDFYFFFLELQMHQIILSKSKERIDF